MPTEIIVMERTTIGEERSSPMSVQMASVNPGLTAFIIWMNDTCRQECVQRGSVALGLLVCIGLQRGGGQAGGEGGGGHGQTQEPTKLLH